MCWQALVRICASAGSFLPRMYSDLKRTMGNRYRSDMVRVTLSYTSKAGVCSCSQCVIERRECNTSRSVSKNCYIHQNRQSRRSGVSHRANVCIAKPVEYRDLSWSRRGPTTCQPHSYQRGQQMRRASINFAIDVGFSDSAPLNYRPGINFPRSSGACRGFVLFIFFRMPYNEGIKVVTARFKFNGT